MGHPRSVEFARLAAETSHITSLSTLRRGIAAPSRGLGHSLRGMKAAGMVDGTASVASAVAAASEWMLRAYRTEGVYKNAIANQLLIQRHSLASTALLSELKAGRSVADCVIVNGSATAYEIKTELDSPARLRRQLEDYQGAFRKVYLVTHRSLVKPYLDLLADSPVGVIALQANGVLRTRRRAQQYEAALSVDTMFKTLRKSEYTRIAEAISGETIDVPATAHFRTCLEVSRSISPLVYSGLFEGELRGRRARAGQSLCADEFRHIRHQLFRVDPTNDQLTSVREWLSERV